MEKILVIDDDQDLRLLLNRFLTRNGYDAETMQSGKAALEWLQKNKPDLVLCDFKLDDMTGAKLLGELKNIYPSVPVIIITGYSDVKDAVEVMKMGAYDYVTKPLFPDEILLTIKKALTDAKQPSAPNASGRVNDEHPGLTPEASTTEYITVKSAEYQAILKQIELVAPTNYSVIIYGESGSGKEVIARQIHEKSVRAHMPFIAIDCGALSKELAGSELFGHEKGSFTGAITQKIGSFEHADGGTLFLDEIGNLSYDIQVSLLRVVQERKIKRIGSNKDIALDVRIVVASNERLWDAACNGKFREDLYHRLNEFSIDVPPLRARKKDIMQFAHFLLEKTNTELGKDVQGFTPEVEEIFLEYPWYGNLRELKNVIKRATLLTDIELIDVKSLPFEISNYQKLQFDVQDQRKEELLAAPPVSAHRQGQVLNKLKSANLDAEYEIIMTALKETNFNKSKAAKLLNIDRKTLYNKMEQYNALKLNE